VRARVLQPLQQHDDIDERASLSRFATKKLSFPRPGPREARPKRKLQQEPTFMPSEISQERRQRGPFNACRRWSPRLPPRKRGFAGMTVRGLKI
jgi:hypothetical protein